MAKKNIPDPDEVLHIQAKPGKLLKIGAFVYGDRGTVQIKRREIDRVEGAYDIVDPADVPDAAERPAA